MQQAPAWLSYASPLIALLALFVSLATYRRAGPRVRLNAYSSKSWKWGDPNLKIAVVVQNSGLAPVQIVGIRLGMEYMGVVGILPTLDLGSDARLEGPELKIKLENGHQIEWTFDAITAMKRQFGDNYEKFRSTLPDLLTRPGSVGPTVRRLLRFVVIPISFLRFGVVAVVDLGNGVQAYSRPMYRLTFRLLPYVKGILAEEGRPPLHE